MKLKTPPIRILVWTGLTIAVGTALLWKGASDSPSESGTPRPLAANSPSAPVDAPAPRKPDARDESVPAEAAGVFIDDAPFRLALDEAVVRDADGKESILRLEPPATFGTLAARLAEFSHRGTVLPVVYPVESGADPALRRVVTADLRVLADDPQRAAASAGLRVSDLPSYAPGWAVMSAADPFEALAAMETLRDNRDVRSADVLLAVRHSLRAMPNDPLVSSQWHLKNSSSARTHVNIENAWNYGGTGGVKGTGIRIGIVDDGLQTAHPDLAANVDTTNDKDWNGNDSDPNPGTGDDHGTACAGNAAARGNNALGVAGTAPEATLVGMRLIAASTTDAQEAEAMAYRNDIIQVKSNSWGPSDTGTLLEAPGSLTRAAFQDAVANGRGGKGTIFLWAGGNGGNVGDNSNYDGYANAVETIAIGASDSSGGRSYYSEPGANVVVCAPSDGGSLGITTVDRTGSNGYNTSSSANGGDYTDDFGGTSSATPTAAGIVALMLEKNPNLGWRDVQEVLIRSAHKIQPSGSGWATNSAGLSFHHDFGAGLIDANAAVAMAATWTNLAPRVSTTSSQTGLSVAIPNNNSAGVTRTFDLTTSNIRVEHVTLTLSASHTARGNLEVVLTSPGGMSSRLAEQRSDTGDNYSSWKFSSVRHWGESSAGNWTLRVSDLSSSGNSTGGTLTAAVLEVSGTPAVPVNPPPVVQITSPSDGAVFSPGATVDITVSASDLNAAGEPGVVAGVELFAGGVSLGMDTGAPYQFSWSPANGAHVLYAVATDGEGASRTSASVGISVVNQAPVISAAVLDAAGQLFADLPLSVASVTASDPESAPLTYFYQWQSSSDGVSFADDAGQTSATLPPSPSHAAKLWRCVVTASDGGATSAPFTTESVNLLFRPVSSVAAGASYSHQSGLVLRGTENTLSRKAVIHEFSQGPSGGSAEWIEILTLQDGSLAFWDIQDAAGNMIVFLDGPVWDDIPAGTLIVVYNGASKDGLLPADDGDPSDGRMIVSSTDPAFFETGYDAWPSLNNSGDSIFLSDEESVEVHSLAYGNSAATTPNIGVVGSGSSAHYTGGGADGIDSPANWKVTSSTIARATRALAPGVSLASGSYSQDFNTTPGASGTGYPDGWTSFNGAIEDTVMTVGSQSSTTGANYNYGSRVGILGSGNAFGSGSIVLALQNTSGLSGLAISYTITKVREASRSHDWILEYSLSSPTSGYTAVANTGYTSGTISEGTVTPFSSIALPAELENQPGTVYLRWNYVPSTIPGEGARDGLALDDVLITTSNPSSPSLSVSVSPGSFAENAGSSAALGTVTVSPAPESDLTVALVSSDTGEAVVPASVTISAGQTSATFPVGAVDDAEQDGTQSVTISASAPGHTGGAAVVTVTDDETPLEGVTPGAPNTPVNAEFVNALRNGLLNSPALFRIGAGADIPAGLVLDASTGLLAGTIDPSVTAGDHLVVIERFNTLGEVVSESFVLSVTGGAAGDFASWIASYPTGGLDGAADDADHDGIPNAVENHLGTRPDAPSMGLHQVSSAPGTLVFRHTRSNATAADLDASYEWSADLATWHASGAATSDGSVTITPAVVSDLDAPDNDIVEVTCVVSGPARVFVRLVVERD